MMHIPLFQELGRDRQPSAFRRQKRELWKCGACGKRGKPKTGFPLFPRAPWKSRQKAARFPHSQQLRRRRRMEKWKTKSRFPTFPPPRFLSHKKKTTPRGGLRPPAARRFAPPQWSPFAPPAWETFTPPLTDWQVGVNYLHSDESEHALWYSLPDIVASVILTGKVSKHY